MFTDCRRSMIRVNSCTSVVEVFMYSVAKLEEFSPAELDKSVAELTSALERESAAVANDDEWKQFRDRWMARKNGILTQINDVWLKAAPGPAKREVGRRVNELKARVEQAVEAAQQRLSGAGSDARLLEESVDVTLPGIRRPL